MKCTHSEVFNFEGAIRGMRNPKNSWDRSDSYYENGVYILGPNDLQLATALISGGSEHRKFLRQIFVSVDITAPLYIWSELDTYKVGTTADSQSTMHKLKDSPITLEGFEIEDLSNIKGFDEIRDSFIEALEWLRQMYNSTKDPAYWKEMKRWLPSAWLQTRTWTGNYEVLRSIYHQRKNHRLIEWQVICRWIESLPYAKELIIGN
jgi:alpha-mannosidase